MRDYRVRVENAQRLVAALRLEGYEARVSPRRPHTRWDNGCADPQCCDQHPEARLDWHGFPFMPVNWCAVETDASSDTVHQCLTQ